MFHLLGETVSLRCLFFWWSAAFNEWGSHKDFSLWCTPGSASDALGDDLRENEFVSYPGGDDGDDWDSVDIPIEFYLMFLQIHSPHYNPITEVCRLASVVVF